MDGTCAGITDGHTEYVDAGFTLMDLVKHALKTVINVLRPQDRLAMIVFSDNSMALFDFTGMDQANKEMSIKHVDTLRGTSSTNAYAGLEHGCRLVANRTDKSRNASVLFFTDG